ncbi:MAG: hypothetical protein ACI4VQ_06290 [Clostridia bacterium]
MDIIGIKVGNYIRFGNGGIHKIYEVSQDYFTLEKSYKVSYKLLTQISSFKTGSTKMELIYKGDIVNGKIVDRVTTGMIALNYCSGCGLWEEVIDNDSPIKTILTKEQYKNNCYEEGA